MTKKKLSKKVAIITGAGRGIGKAIAIEFAREGAKVAVSDIDSKTSREVCKKIQNLGHEAISVKCDVTKIRNIRNLVSKTLNEFGKIDIFVNNAGLFFSKPFVDVSESEWSNLIKTNLTGVFLGCSGIAEYMIKQKSGKIINIASIAGEVGFMNSSAFSAANGGIVNFTKHLALELSPHQINVNCVSPGIIATPLIKELLEDKRTNKELLSNIPMNRFGTSDEVANAVVFLASQDADYITGHNLVVDGGWTSH